MRPTAIQPSLLTQPFNRLLGREANVRILRVLCQAAAPLGRAEVGRRAELNDSGVRRALNALVDFGIVEPVATGTQAVRLQTEHPLVAPLSTLFDAESSRYETILDSLGAAAMAVMPAPSSAWVDGVASYGTDKGHGLVLTIVVGSKDSITAADQLLVEIHRHMQSFDVRVTPRVLTRADLAAGLGLTGEPEDMVVVVAPHPDDLLRQDATYSSERTHADHDRHQLKIARAIADRLAHDPDLLNRTVEDLRRRVTVGVPVTDPRAEWLSYLDHQSTARIREMLIDESESATRLRQSLPFLEVLSESERAHLLKQVTNDEE